MLQLPLSVRFERKRNGVKSYHIARGKREKDTSHILLAQLLADRNVQVARNILLLDIKCDIGRVQHLVLDLRIHENTSQERLFLTRTAHTNVFSPRPSTQILELAPTALRLESTQIALLRQNAVRARKRRKDDYSV